MNELRADFPPASEHMDPFAKAIEFLMAALVIFSPLALGVVQAWSEQVFVCIAGLTALCMGFRFLFVPGLRPVFTWAYIPLGLFLLLTLFQVLELPVSVINAVAPNTVSLKKELLSHGAGPAAMSISFYREGTLHDLRLAVSIAVIFAVAVNYYRTREQLFRLFWLIAGTGAAIGILAVFQVITETDGIFWIITGKSDIVRGGSFVNRNNFCQFMNLSMGASVVLLLFHLEKGVRQQGTTLRDAIDWLGSPQGKIIWILSIFIIIGITSVFLSLGRGGAISLLIAGTLTTLLITSRFVRQGKGWVIALLALCAFISVLYLGFDAVYDRLATLQEKETFAENNRWQIIKDIALAWTRFPLVGTGFGTHEVVYPMFDRSTVPRIAGYAENEYAQLAEETGSIGLVLIGLFGFVVIRNYIRCLCRKDGISPFIGYGLGYGLIAVAIHSFSDFGLHLPANAVLAALYCGIIIRIGRPARQVTEATLVGRAGTRAAAAVFLIVFLPVFSWAVVTADSARRAEAHWRKAMKEEQWIAKQDEQVSNLNYKTLISHAAEASRLEPGNIQYRYWLQVFRWRSISRVRDPKTGAIITTPKTIEFVERIVDELHKARRICPTFGPLYCVAGQLETFVLGRPIGRKHIRKGYRLAPCDPTVCYVAGLLDATEGDMDASFAKFQRTLELDALFFKDIAHVYINRIDKPEKALELAGDALQNLYYVERLLGGDPAQRELFEKARDKRISLIKTQCEDEQAPPRVKAELARIYQEKQDYQNAVLFYRQALSEDYGHVYWRYNLAECLAKLDQTGEAIHEARICLRLRPHFEAAERLIGALSTTKNEER